MLFAQAPARPLFKEVKKMQSSTRLFSAIILALRRELHQERDIVIHALIRGAWWLINCEISVLTIDYRAMFLYLSISKLAATGFPRECIYLLPFSPLDLTPWTKAAICFELLRCLKA